MTRYPTGHPWQWFADRTFAQHGEDILFLSICHCLGIQQPTYLDVGCEDPYAISNTALLYLRGCKGINVDVDAGKIAQFRRHRPEDTNIVAGIGPEPGEFPYYLLGGHSSFVKELVYPHGSPQVVMTQVTTLEEIVAQHANGVFPDLLSIDIEGYDLPVLKSYDFKNKSHPKVICTEAFCDHHDYHTDISKVLVDAGYFFYVWAGANMIFVHRDYHRCIFF